MPYWLTNPDHGTMPVYAISEVDRNKANGWTLLNIGESPVRVPVVNGDTARIPEDVIEEQSCAQMLKGALAESMRLDPPPVWSKSAKPADIPVEFTQVKRKPGRPPKAK